MLIVFSALILAIAFFVGYMIFSRLSPTIQISQPSQGEQEGQIVKEVEPVEFSFVDLLVEARFIKARCEHLNQICVTQKQYISGHGKTLRIIVEVIDSMKSPFLNQLNELQAEKKNIIGFESNLVDVTRLYNEALSNLRAYGRSDDIKAASDTHRINAYELLGNKTTEAIDILEQELS